MNSTHSSAVATLKTIALLITIPFALPVVAAPKFKLRFTVTDLGALPGGYETVASKINNRGQVVGSTHDAGGFLRPFIYSDGVMTAVPLVGLGLDINDSGAVVGQYTANNQAHGFLYSGGVVTDLNPLLAGADWVAAAGINAAGQIVGWGGPVMSDLPYPIYPAFWISNGVAAYFPRPNRTYYTTAYEINSAGQAAGDLGVFTNDTGVLQHACILQSDRFIDLGTLPGGHLSAARALNDAGDVVGWSFYGHPPATDIIGVHAALYRHGTVINLGSLPGHASSYAYDINNGGWIVGFCEDEAGTLTAFLHADGAMHDLNGLLKEETDWKLRWATGINDQGQIVGHGWRGGELRSFLLTPTKKPKL